MNVNGNSKALFSVHGTIEDAEKVLKAMESMTDKHDFNINELNDTSETGGIYIKQNGEICDTFSKSDEAIARYKIVPTGLTFRYSDYPLLASFIKLKGQWEGCFVGTATMLFDMYKQHYRDGEFNEQYKEVFGGDNRSLDVKGFGLTEVLGSINDNEIIYSTEDKNTEVSSQLETALKKLQNKVNNEQTGKNNQRSKNKNKHKTKAQRKAERLQQHLNKVNAQKEEQAKKEAEQEKEQERLRILEEEESKKEFGIIWHEILNIEDVHAEFVDDATKALNERILQYINSEDNKDTAYKITGDATTEFEETVENEETEAEETEAEETEAESSEKVIEQIETEKSADKVEIKTKKSSNKQKENKHTDDNEEEILNELSHDNIITGDSYQYCLQIKNDLINDIYDRLLIKENWKVPKFNQDTTRMRFHLRGLCFYIWREQHETDSIRGNGYTYSDNKSKVVINTGLIDTYGNYIYIIDHTPKIMDFYNKVISIMQDRASLLKQGFNIENVKNLPQPVEIVKDKSELIFNADFDEFDLDDKAHLYHIIQERIKRFPEKYRNESEVSLCDKIKAAIKQAIMISKSDCRYVLPKYDFSRRQVQFLVPFYLDRKLDESPELTIVVGKNTNGLWSIYTVLNSDDAYDDTRLLCKANDSWLSPARKQKGNKK
jgi:hypothetical protein